MNKTLSIYLDLLRFLAAVIVFIAHANYDRYTGGLPILWRLSASANDAVMMFFVLSGFVIAYVAHTKEFLARDYFVSRFSRLYSVVVPALLLTVILHYLGSLINPGYYDQEWHAADNPILRFLANFFFVNELWFYSVRPFSNGPFWSLGYEFWYIFCGLFLYAGQNKICPNCISVSNHGPENFTAFAGLAYGRLGI